MKEQLQQLAVNALESEKIARSVGVGSVATAIFNTAYDIMHPVLSLLTLIAGLLLSLVLHKNRTKKGILMDQELILMKKEVELKNAQIKAIGERKQGRGDEQ